MTLQTINPITFIDPPDTSNSAFSLANITLDAVDEKVAVIMEVPVTGILTKFGFLTGTVTTGATMEGRIETVSLTNGDPTGTLYDVNGTGTVVVADIDDDTWKEISINGGTGITVTKGDFIALVINNPNPTFGTLDIKRTAALGAQSFPYLAWNLTGSWSQQSAAAIFGVEYSGGVYHYIPRVFPVSGLGSNSIDKNSADPEQGVKFKVPFKCRVTGFWMPTRGMQVNTDIKLYDSDGSTVLGTHSHDGDIRSISNMVWFGFFDNTAVLSIDTFYRLVNAPTTTSNLDVFFFDVDAAAKMGQMEMGQNWHWTQGDAGSWTDTVTRRPIMGLMADQLDDGLAGDTIIPRGANTLLRM